MRKKNINTIGSAALLTVGLISAIGFANWTTENSKPHHTYATMIAEEESAEESRVSEREAEIAATETTIAISKYYSAAPAPVIKEYYFETYTETSTEPLTEAPTTSIELQTTIEVTEVTQVTEVTTSEEPTTEAVTEPITEPVTEPVTVAETLPEYSREDYLLMIAASCEAGGQGPEGIALVMRVILNRCAVYGASIDDVIYAPGQFACVGSDIWNSGYISPDAPAALALIRAGWDESQGALYFCTPAHNSWHRSTLIYLFTYGDHEFYKV